MQIENKEHILALARRYPALQSCTTQIEQAIQKLIMCFAAGGKLLVCGNGGSCADAHHIVGELMKGFLLPRGLSKAQKGTLRAACPSMPEMLLDSLQGALPALTLCGETALSTAFANDVSPIAVFAQQVYGYGCAGDVLLGISTSGNAENVCAAAITAKACGLHVVSLTGAGGGKLATLSEVCIRVPETETFKVQELHLPVYHALCAQVEQYFFGDEKKI